ncbi:hypothetical protein O9993_17030 [Vibrio lentus]|nr:hypothetical protein [Vibrio lentus]
MGRVVLLICSATMPMRFALTKASVMAIPVISPGAKLRINPALLYGKTQWTDDKQARKTLFPGSHQL